jgi:acyl-CoA thioester hydrolase
MIRTDIQKRFADVDMLGHVNNVNLMHYFDVGKNDFFARVIDIGSHLEGTGLITASVKVDYLSQTRLRERSHVETYVEKLGNKSMTLFQRLVDSDTGAVHVELHAVMVAFDYARQQSVEIPDWWRGVLSEHYI